MPGTGYATEWNTAAAIAARSMVYRRDVADRRRNAGFLLGGIGLRFMKRTERDILRSLCDWLTPDELEGGNTLVVSNNPEIGTDVGIGERSVQAGLEALERDGWIVRTWTTKPRRNGGGAGIDLAPLYCRLDELQAAFDERNDSRRAKVARVRKTQLELAVDNCRLSETRSADGTQENAPKGAVDCTPYTRTAISSINLDGCKGRQEEEGGHKSLPVNRMGRQRTDPPDGSDAAFARLRAVMHSIDPDRPLRRTHTQPADDAALLAALELALSSGVRRRDVLEAVHRHGAITTLAALVVVRINVARGTILRSPAR